MRRFTMAFAAATALLATSQAGARSLDLNVSGDSAQIQYKANLASAPNQLVLDASYLYSDGTNDTQDENVGIGGLGLMAAGDVGAEPHSIVANVGAKAYLIHVTDLADGVALAPTAGIHAVFQGASRLGFGAQLAYAPKILSFGDSESFLHFSARVEYQLLRAARVYLGYRHVEGEFDDGGSDVDATLDSGLHVGFKLDF